MIFNKDYVNEIKCYYKAGTEKPDINLPCVPCTDFDEFAKYENPPAYETDRIAIIKGKPPFTRCGWCAFPNCTEWVDRENEE